MAANEIIDKFEGGLQISEENLLSGTIRKIKNFDKEYRQIKQIASGAFGVTFLYIRLHDEKQVIIKKIKDHPRNRKSSIAEALVLQKLNIVINSPFPHFYDAFIDNGDFCIVMEYIQGETLRP